MSVVARGEYTISPLADGATGRGVSSVVSQYAVSTSKTTAPSDASFSTNRPTWEPGKYVWTRSLITYTSGSPATSTTTPVVSSEWEAVNEVKVGGRNLIRNSNFYSGTNNWVVDAGTMQIVSDALYGNVLKASVTSGSMRIFNSTSNVWRANTWYSYSFWAKAASPVTIKASRSLADSGPIHNITTTWAKYTGTIYSTVDTEGGTLSFLYGGTGIEVQFANIKLEIGNKPTDWTPAPEDVDAKIDEVSQDVSGANAAIDQIISANATKQAELDAQINNLNLALSSLSAGVGENNTSTQGAIDAIQAMIATLEAQRSALSDKIASLEQAKIKTDNYIQIGTVKLSNGTTVFGVAVGKDVNILNPDGTISTFERSMTATTANEFMILTGGAVVGVFDATGMTSESVKVNKIVMGNRFAWSMTPSQMMVLKKGG